MCLWRHAAGTALSRQRCSQQGAGGAGHVALTGFGQETQENVELHVRDRGATLFNFYTQGHPSDAPSLTAHWAKPVTPTPPTRATTASPSTKRTTRLRGPLSTPSRPLSALLSLGHRRSADIVIKQKNASAARRVRMHELQRGMIDHDEERLAEVARGTSPLLGARGQAMLPVPPVEVDPLRVPLELRLRLAAGNKISKSFRRPWLMAAHAANEEAKDLPLQYAVVEAFEDTMYFDVAHPSAEGPIPRQEYEIPRRFQSPKDLLLRGEELIEAEALEDQCMPIAWRFLAATYDATPQEVLMMLRQVKSFTTKNHGFTTASRKELEQIADEILHSLATRLEDAPAYFLKEVLETMKQCEVGSTAFSHLVQLLLARRSDAPM
ncbi:unnamed protein product [Durusdinium trenchii]|uniref:Uncharacterized protein n=1 Tax=Durusdinium trenchii TaxID=1381693 RepID=A0ABP0MKQ2_9DINO